MFQRDDFVFHLAHFHAPDRATRLVKKIDQRARQAADENDQEAKGTNENRLCLRDSAKAAEHDL
jgi:hypothetical protein